MSVTSPSDQPFVPKLDNTIAVTDPFDPRIEVFQGLRDHSLRMRRERWGDMKGVFVCEGDRVVERALRSDYELVSILIDGKRKRALPGAVPTEIPVYAAAPQVLEQITGYHLHRGALACFHRRVVPDAVSILSDPSIRTIVVAEAINNPTNMGVILRCAAALGVDAFLLDPSCCDPLYRRCARVSMGEAFALPYARLDEFPSGLDIVKEHGFTTLALTPAEDAVDLGDLRLGTDERVAILLGAEGPGLTVGALEAVEKRVRIPMSGVVDSINVGSASAVSFYGVQQARRLR